MCQKCWQHTVGLPHTFADEIERPMLNESLDVCTSNLSDEIVSLEAWQCFRSSSQADNENDSKHLK